ncbi:MAG: heme NO-binding domain-containing protein [Myxococcota bacterium]
MHGVIFAELRAFVGANLGEKAWDELLKAAGMSGRMFLPMERYPDADALALVTTASRLTGKPVPVLLEAFGEFIGPNLVKKYQRLIKPEWRTLDVLLNTQGAIHRVVQIENKGAAPPELVCNRSGTDEVTITYGSARKMCGVAKGIITALARHYDEPVGMVERQCMHGGAPNCVIVVRVGDQAPQWARSTRGTSA